MIPVSVVAWLGGLAAYEGWLRIAWGQTMGSEWTAVAFLSALAFGVAAVVVYAPLAPFAAHFRWVRKHGHEPFAFLKSSNVPTRDQWQQAIDRTGADHKLDPELQPRTNVVFVPLRSESIAPQNRI